MTITFLGTGTSQGVPVIACNCQVCCSLDPRDKRLRTSVLVSDGKNNVVIDTGPDFRQQMLRENITNLQGVVFTHEHKDHVAGLDDVRAFNYFQKSKMDIFCTSQVEFALKREFHYAFSGDDYPGIPELRINNIGTEPFDTAGIHFIPIEVMHMKMPVLGFRINDFTYITDANFISEQSKEKIAGSTVLVLNALRKKDHPSHYSLPEALKLVKELNPAFTYLTHISHQLGRQEDVEKELPENVRLAFDGLKIEI